MIYAGWKSLLDPQIDLQLVELSGRGKRIHEPSYLNMEEAVDDLFSHVCNNLNPPYAFFGHSMGSLISYELTQLIVRKGFPPPMHVFFSGRGAPNVQLDDEPAFHLMDDRQFSEELVKLGGTPPEFFSHPELAEVFVPILKNDFRIVETYEGTETINPLNMEISVFLGKQDDQSAEQCDAWRNHSTELCRLYYFNGGHFFFNENSGQIIRIINSTLLQA